MISNDSICERLVSNVLDRKTKFDTIANNKEIARQNKAEEARKKREEINEAAKISSFSVEISGSGLEVTSANSKIPAQTISESSSISLAADSNKVVLATISGGKLSIDIDNYIISFCKKKNINC